MTRAQFELVGRRIWVSGHRGMVGSALLRRLQHEDCEILTVERRDLDLRRQRDVEQWVREANPDAAIVAAATVGGILANDTRPAEFLYDNLAIATNVIEASRLAGVKKLLFLGSSCIYPKFAPQPIPEGSLLTGALEPTNQWYAIAKIADLMLCRAYRGQYGCDFISAMPTNLYGPGDKFDLVSSHVIPALVAKAEQSKRAGARELQVWGTGAARREFMYVDDLADALVFLLVHYSEDDHVNIGVGQDITIRELAETIMRVVGLDGRLTFDRSKPDGTPRKLLDSSKLFNMGWRPKTSFEDGLRKTYSWYVQQLGSPRHHAEARAGAGEPRLRGEP